MSVLAIETHALRKTYGRRVAVNDLDLAVPAGGVHGFLGPNGSGKTTSIRMLLGLVRADSGTMRIFGHDVPRELPSVVARVGAIVESPKFFPTFTARKNLNLLADAIGAPRTRVEEVLAETGLADRAKDRYAGYSLGMKQRLAVAATLLKSPDLLIFDEPTNGLDPSGIREIRDTMRSLGEQGRTVLVSSHILAEVGQIADTVSIIGRGRLLASGPVAEVIGNRTVDAVRVGVADAAGAQAVLLAAGLRVTPEGDMLLVRDEPDPARITYLLAQREIYVRELLPVRADLESVFLELTRGEGLPVEHRASGRDRRRGRRRSDAPPAPQAGGRPVARSADGTGSADETGADGRWDR
ncbi:ABC transporter ATP-binding protein [Georgenia faecalis]|uniref:ABC transporter ATP-binding protein n=1 Tax=Georgenia faecalis TaxID=2483799 RepID=A0ABV9D6S8_9MICO|nr:ATP-binding cassette domain-containing protein [Georgenia faecalis]